MRRAILVACLTLTIASFSRADETPDRAGWMKDARFGVMNHYLEDWIARRENLPERRMTRRAVERHGRPFRRRIARESDRIDRCQISDLHHRPEFGVLPLTQRGVRPDGRHFAEPLLEARPHRRP